MTSKRSKEKSPTKRSKTRRLDPSHNGKSVPLTDAGDTDLSFESARRSRPGPRYIKGESPEAREKRLAARKARTLKAFQKTYENRHPKTS